jgi:hypothetical protein
MLASSRSMSTTLQRTGRWAAFGLGVGLGSYAAYAAASWFRFGRLPPAAVDTEDSWLDRFMPQYDVVERHQIAIGAPPSVTLAAACEQDLNRSPIIRGIFKARELALGSEPAEQARPHGLLAETIALGWGVLAEEPGHEIVMGAVTQPWMADPAFRALPPARFASFDEPGFVKIVWTLRADPVPRGGSLFRTETRAIATDAAARAKFRRYWALASPGIWLIRQLLLKPLKVEAERRAALAA